MTKLWLVAIAALPLPECLTGRIEADKPVAIADAGAKPAVATATAMPTTPGKPAPSQPGKKPGASPTPTAPTPTSPTPTAPTPTAPTPTAPTAPTPTAPTPTAPTPTAPTPPAPTTPPPAPTTPPPPAPTTPSDPNRVLVFTTARGNAMGLYPKAADIFAVFDTNSPAIKKCFTAANATSDDWAVSTRIYFAKDSTRTVSAYVTHAGQDDSGSATGQAIIACVKTTMLSWNWPKTNDIDGNNGGPGYLVCGGGFSWRRK